MGLVGRKSFLRAKLHLIRVGRSLEPWAPQEIITDDCTDTLGPLCQVLVTLEPSPWRITRPTQPQILLQSFGSCRGSLVFGRGGHCHPFTRPANIYCTPTGTGTEGYSVKTHRSLLLRREVLKDRG